MRKEYDFYFSDPHFGHSKEWFYKDMRGFSSVEEMNETLIENFNKKASKNSNILCLGDAFITTEEKAREIFSRLKGNFDIVDGNHDRYKNHMHWIKDLFNDVKRNHVIKIDSHKINLHHYPYVDKKIHDIALKAPNILKAPKSNIPCSSIHISDEYFENVRKDPMLHFDFLIKYHDKNFYTNKGIRIRKFLLQLIRRYITPRLVNDGNILMHGHTHSFNKIRENMINLSVEAWDFNLASNEEIKDCVKKIRKDYYYDEII